MKRTPWGTAQDSNVLADGIVSYSTAGHGGIWLSAARVRQLPAGIDNFLHDLRWWEEDCDWVVPYILFADDIRSMGRAYRFEDNLATAKVIASHHYPELLKV